jgi:hypothetical protein
VIRDPFARLPVSGRLWAAALLCIVPLGLVWSKVNGVVTNGIFGPGYCDYDGYCEPGIYTAGVYVPGSTTHVSQSPARVFLLVAAAALVFTATRVRTAATRKVARLATGSLAFAAGLAASHRATLTLVCVLLALALVAPAVWAQPARGRLFGSGPSPG